MQSKKLLFVIRYVLNQYKTQDICDKAILESGHSFKSVPDCYKNKKMCIKAVNNYIRASFTSIKICFQLVSYKQDY